MSGSVQGGLTTPATGCVRRLVLAVLSVLPVVLGACDWDTGDNNNNQCNNNTPVTLDPTDYTYTLEEVGRIFKVTRERVRQIESKAVHKLRHPVRAMQLEGFLERAA